MTITGKFLLAGLLALPLASLAGEAMKRLPDPINNASGDLAPTLSADGRVLVFQSNRPGGQGWYDLYESRWDGKKWSAPRNIREINSKFFDGLPSLSADGNSLYFSTNRETKDPEDQNLDIWMSERGKDGNFREPFALKFLNSPVYDSKPSISFDGKTLYFVTLREGGPGGMDIWFTQKISEDEWSVPEPMASPFNSEYDEIDPNLLAAGDQFYFASNRPGGFGAFDLYRCLKKADGSWSVPENIGKEINGPDNEYFFTLPAIGDFIYISRGESNKEDIFKVDLPPHLRPTPIIILKGKVVDDESNIAIAKVPVDFVNRKTSAKYSLTATEDGEITGILIAGVAYDIAATFGAYLPFQMEFDTASLSHTYEKAIEIRLQKEKKKPSEFNGVYFRYFDCMLTDESKVSLQLYLQFLQENPGKSIVVNASSDYREGKKVRKKLSERRAKRVMNYLKDIGIPESRIRMGELDVQQSKTKDQLQLQYARNVTIDLK